MALRRVIERHGYGWGAGGGGGVGWGGGERYEAWSQAPSREFASANGYIMNVNLPVKIILHECGINSLCHFVTVTKIVASFRLFWERTLLQAVLFVTSNGLSKRPCEATLE